jgi:two-component system, OmpR family, response regulator
MIANTGALRQPQDSIVYVVEDDQHLGQDLCGTLRLHGFRPQHFSTAATFLHFLKTQPPALSMIDLGLPDHDGIQLVKQVQAISKSAILILSSRQTVADRILALELGADDFMVKPYDPREVVARAHSILRRVERNREEQESGRRRARFGGLIFDVSCNRLLAEDGREIEQLAIGEAKLLATMLRSANRILTRTELMGDSDREAFDRSIDARISRLRRKLRADGPEIIKTVYGAGYMLIAKVEWE